MLCWSLLDGGRETDSTANQPGGGGGGRAGGGGGGAPPSVAHSKSVPAFLTDSSTRTPQPTRNPRFSEVMRGRRQTMAEGGDSPDSPDGNASPSPRDGGGAGGGTDLGTVLGPRGSRGRRERASEPLAEGGDSPEGDAARDLAGGY